MDLLPYIYFDEITHAILFADDTLSFTADPLWIRILFYLYQLKEAE